MYRGTTPTLYFTMPFDSTGISQYIDELDSIVRQERYVEMPTDVTEK